MVNTISKEIVALVTDMVSFHDSGDFEKLKNLMNRNTLETVDTFFTKKKFDEVREKIQAQLGKCENLEYIGQLDKIDFIQTLWKARYSKTEEEILWSATISDCEGSPKIIKMSVN